MTRSVFWVRPGDWSLPEPDADAERTGEGLAAAMRRNRITRVVFQRSIGAEMRRGAGFVDGLARIEERLDAARDETSIALLHLPCGFFMTNLLMDLDGLRAGRLTTVRLLDEPMPWVDPGGIAAVATVRLLADGWTGRRCRRCTGPPDLTWTEAAAGTYPVASERNERNRAVRHHRRPHRAGKQAKPGSVDRGTGLASVRGEG
jgi:hypothetical protein